MRDEKYNSPTNKLLITPFTSKKCEIRRLKIKKLNLEENTEDFSKAIKKNIINTENFFTGKENRNFKIEDL